VEMAQQAGVTELMRRCGGLADCGFVATEE